MTKTNNIYKSMITVILVTALVLTMAITTTNADSTKTYGGFKYQVKGSSAKYGSGIYIKAYTGSKTSISIPKKINGKYVVYVDLDEENIKSINVKNATKLKYLDVSENRLTKLSTKQNKKLIELDASENKLKSVSLKNNTKLKELDLSHNKLTKLDVSKNLKLRELDIEGNSGLSWFTINNLAKHKYLNEFTGASGQEWERD